MIILKWIAIDH